MNAEADFTDYASARWATLVRSGVVLGCSLEDAQDLAQTTLLRCFKSWRKVQAAEDRDAYVYRILLNCFRDSRRRRWWGERTTDSLPDGASPDPTAQSDLTDAVHRALAEIPSSHREVVMLRYFAHLSERQTAELLGIPPGTVKSRLSRALAQLTLSSHLLIAKDD